MYCSKCGVENADNALKCINCGEALRQAAPPTPPPVQHVPTRLAPAILVTLFCCLPFGIVAIVYAARANGELQSGNYDAARDASRKAAIWCWVSFGVGILFVMISILAAIAIPQFVQYRNKAFNVSARTYLMNAAAAQEAYFSNHASYTESLENLRESEYSLSIDENITLQIIYADNEGYEMTAYHEKGDKAFTLKGPEGTIQETRRR